VGLFKAWKEAKAVLSAGPQQPGPRAPQQPGHRNPHPPGGMLMAFQAVMMKMQAPMLAAMAPERGLPLPGTAEGVGTAQDPPALDAGIAAVRSRDSAFDVGVLTTFAGQVFSTVGSAWGTGDAQSVRSLLSDQLWEPMSAALMTGGGMAALVYSHESAQPALSGAWADPLYDSALFSFAVTVDLPPDPSGRIPVDMMHWEEEWLFQRSVTPEGDATLSSATCPSCGAPVPPDTDGLCPHCRQPIPVLTPGWLVTYIRSHNALVEQWRDQIVAQIRANPQELQMMPDELVRLLPADLVTSVDPQRAAALHLRTR
jgi:hypothetical protein